MRLLLSYKEISRYVASNYGQELDFSAVSPDTLKVSFAKKVVLTTVRLSVNLRIEKVEPAQVYLSYSGNTGVEMIIAGAIKMLLNSKPVLAEAISPDKDNRISVNLARFKKLKPALEKIELQAISVKEEGIEISAGLK